MIVLKVKMSVVQHTQTIYKVYNNTAHVKFKGQASGQGWPFPVTHALHEGPLPLSMAAQ